jgi:predicted GIY-YIG superfamily endonuclease
MRGFENIDHCVYVIDDHTADKKYIGSTERPTQRLVEHTLDLKRGAHRNKHLQQAYNQGHQLQITVIPLEPEASSREVEQQMIDEHWDSGRLYNVVRNVMVPRKGLFHSEETKKKQSEAAQRRWSNPEERQRQSVACTGIKKGPSHAAKVSQVRREASAAMTPEERKKMVEKAHAGSRKKVVAAGTQYDSIGEACAATGTIPSTVYNRLNNPNFKDWYYV